MKYNAQQSMFIIDKNAIYWIQQFIKDPEINGDCLDSKGEPSQAMVKLT